MARSGTGCATMMTPRYGSPLTTPRTSGPVPAPTCGNRREVLTSGVRGADVGPVNRVRRASPCRPRRASWVGRSRERARSNRGIALVEAAFVTPVFFALVLGVAEIGLVMNNYL